MDLGVDEILNIFKFISSGLGWNEFLGFIVVLSVFCRKYLIEELY